MAYDESHFFLSRSDCWGDSYTYCLLCYKWATEAHLLSDGHRWRAQHPMDYLRPLPAFLTSRASPAGPPDEPPPPPPSGQRPGQRPTDSSSLGTMPWTRTPIEGTDASVDTARGEFEHARQMMAAVLSENARRESRARRNLQLAEDKYLRACLALEQGREVAAAVVADALPRRALAGPGLPPLPPPGEGWTKYSDGDCPDTWWHYEGPLGQWCTVDGVYLYPYPQGAQGAPTIAQPGAGDPSARSSSSWFGPDPKSEAAQTVSVRAQVLKAGEALCGP